MCYWNILPGISEWNNALCLCATSVTGGYRCFLLESEHEFKSFSPLLWAIKRDYLSAVHYSVRPRHFVCSALHSSCSISRHGFPSHWITLKYIFDTGIDPNFSTADIVMVHFWAERQTNCYDCSALGVCLSHTYKYIQKWTVLKRKAL